MSIQSWRSLCKCANPSQLDSQLIDEQNVSVPLKIVEACQTCKNMLAALLTALTFSKLELLWDHKGVHGPNTSATTV